MNEIEEYTRKTFDDIKHIDEKGHEYWEARELMKVLEYKEWRYFTTVIEKAQIACIHSKNNINNDFGACTKIVEAGSTSKPVIDYKLSRYACYLIVQNANPKYKAVALGQTYFAVKTRLQELVDIEYVGLTEDEKRIKKRKDTRTGNYTLNQTAKKAGVRNFDKFHNAGYKGLYGGETADDIARRKGLRYREDILDNMSSAELAANYFRISQTEQKIINEGILGENNVNEAHYIVGKKVRNLIREIGGTMPEDLPTPKKSLKELEKENKLISIKE